jgi:polysaccharide deacetylase family protein (PEP-CTERM system associated)
MQPVERASVVSAPEGEVVSAFTIDVEEYFHVEAFRHLIDPSEWPSFEQRVEPPTRRLLGLLDAFETRATFFVLGWVAERRPSLIRDIVAAGHEVAIHGYDHRPITAMTIDAFREDIRRAKGIVEDVAGAAVLGYRAPTYSIVEDTMWALDVMAEEGIRYDSSIFPIAHDRYGIAHAPRHPWNEDRVTGALLEFPISTVRLLGRNLPFVGGGYLRLLPMPYVRWGMRHVTGVERRPAMLYVHPWELDPGQPVMEVGHVQRYRHYHGMDRVEDRLRSLLSDFRFDTVRSVLGL